MKAVILAGGLGTRISEETHLKPKPMIEIGGKPILWHIMKLYSHHGINDFIVCCGYKGYLIKEYFANYFLHMSDVTFDMRTNSMQVHERHAEPWQVTLVDTGEDTMTGGRLMRVASWPYAIIYKSRIRGRLMRVTSYIKGKRSLPPGSAGVSPAEMAAKMAAFPGKGRGE